MLDDGRFWPELDEADKSNEHDQYLNRRYGRAAAYEVLDGLLTTAIQKHQQVEEQLASFLKSSPTLGRHLACWQAEDANTGLPQPNSPRSQCRSFSFQLGLITALV
jgi:hypothetical protein